MIKIVSFIVGITLKNRIIKVKVLIKKIPINSYFQGNRCQKKSNN